MGVEDVKVSRAQHVSTLVETLHKRFKLNLGKNDVAIVYKIQFLLDLFVPNHSVKVGVYRKTDEVESNIGVRDQVVEDRNWLMVGSYDTGDATYTGSFAINKDINFSPPLVLIRSPQLTLKNNDAESAGLIGSIFYTLKTISDKDMARLMMKYHA